MTEQLWISGPLRGIWSEKEVLLCVLLRHNMVYAQFFRYANQLQKSTKTWAHKKIHLQTRIGQPYVVQQKKSFKSEVLKLNFPSQFPWERHKIAVHVPSEITAVLRNIFHLQWVIISNGTMAHNMLVLSENASLMSRSKTTCGHCIVICLLISRGKCRLRDF